MPILEGLDITARTAGNAVIEKALLHARKAVEAGRTLVDPLKETDVFPGMVTQMIGVGEQTGAMDAMLQKIADFYEDEVDAAVKDLLSAMEPMMIVFLGVVVGGIVISMYLPLFSLIRSWQDKGAGNRSRFGEFASRGFPGWTEWLEVSGAGCAGREAGSLRPR